MSLRKITLFSFLLFITATGAKAQMTLTDTAQAATMVRQLVGSGIIYSNPTLTCT